MIGLKEALRQATEELRNEEEERKAAFLHELEKKEEGIDRRIVDAFKEGKTHVSFQASSIPLELRKAIFDRYTEGGYNVRIGRSGGRSRLDFLMISWGSENDE